MAWSFECDWNHGLSTTKSAVQLCQEAAMVLSLGGGFQMYIKQNRDGSPQVVRNGRIKEISDFVHARKMNFKKKPLAQVGVFYSAESYYAKSEIFNASGATKSLISCINALLDMQYTANVILEYQIDSIYNYDIVVIPEWEIINDSLKNKFIEYAKAGGNLVISGAKTVSQFGQLLGKDFGDIQEDARKYIEGAKCEYMGVFGNFLDIKSGDGVLYSVPDMRYGDIPSYRIDNEGDGKILFLPFDLFESYYKRRSPITIRFLKNVFAQLSNPIIEINRRNIDITMQDDGDYVLVNLINMNQNRHTLDIVTYDEIMPVCDIELTIRKPYKCATMPLGEKFDFEEFKDSVKIHLDRLDIHSVIRLKKNN